MPQVPTYNDHEPLEPEPSSAGPQLPPAEKTRQEAELAVVKLRKISVQLLLSVIEVITGLGGGVVGGGVVGGGVVGGGVVGGGVVGGGVVGGGGVGGGGVPGGGVVGGGVVGGGVVGGGGAG